MPEITLEDCDRDFGGELPAGYTLAADPPGESEPVADARGSGRFLPLNAFVDESMRTLPRVPLAVWVCLWRDTKRKGKRWLARSARSYLARRVGCSESAVTKAIARLKKIGLVECIRRGAPGRIALYKVRGKPKGNSGVRPTREG